MEAFYSTKLPFLRISMVTFLHGNFGNDDSNEGGHSNGLLWPF